MKPIAILLTLATIAILRNLAGENVDAGNPANLRPVAAWPWENCKKENQ